MRPAPVHRRHTVGRVQQQRDDIETSAPVPGSFITATAPLTIGNRRAVADFDGNGTTDKAVFRPSTGQWFVRGGTPEVTNNGASSDVSLPLPYAIRKVFFP